MPKGKPAARAGPAAIQSLTQFELVRARLLLAGDLWGVRRGPEALRWVAAARRAYRALSPRVAAKDARLDGETLAAFDRIGARIRQGQSFDNVRDLLSPLSGQLLDGAVGVLGLRDAAKDVGVEAAVCDRLLSASSEAYAFPPDAFQESYGLFARGQTVARPLAPSMGPAVKHDVIDGLSGLREKAFPEGVAEPRPPYPVAPYRAAIAKARAALAGRFGL